MPPYDPKRELKALYAPKNTTWSLVDVPAQRFLAVDGHGDPNRVPAYAQAVEALYSVAYTLKFAIKRAGGRDFVVGPLEGLWWADDFTSFTTARDKTAWHWTMLISQPPWVTPGQIAEAREAALAKKKRPTIADVRVEPLNEARCAQALHIGPYDAEGPLLNELHTAYLPGQGLEPTGRHHEIYLGDPRKTAPERLRTVLRQPVRPTDQPQHAP